MNGITEFEVLIHDAGPDLKARIKPLFNFMQSAADRHSKSLGTSVSLMSEKNLTWVYSRFYASVDQYPELYDKIRCITWRSEKMNGFICREFIMQGEDGSIKLRATSALALIDKSSRKPVQIPGFITSKLEHEKGRSIDFPQGNIEHNTDFEHVYTTRARYDDIDINSHMNNASYAEIFFESIYSNLHAPMVLRSIDISFRGEILYGDELECGVVQIKGTNHNYYHRLYNKTKGKTAAYAVTEWEK